MAVIFPGLLNKVCCEMHQYYGGTTMCTYSVFLAPQLQ